MQSEGSVSALLRAKNLSLSIVEGIRLVAVAVSRVSRLFTTRNTLRGGIESDDVAALFGFARLGDRRAGDLHNLEFGEWSEHRLNRGARV